MRKDTFRSLVEHLLGCIAERFLGIVCLSCAKRQDWSGVSGSESKHLGSGTYLIVTATKKYANTLTFCALVENVARFLRVGVEGQRRVHERRRNGNFERVPRPASIFCTIMRSSTSEDECLEVCRGVRPSAAG